VGGDEIGHCRGVDHAEPLDAMHAELRVDHRVGAGPHHAGRGRVVGGRGDVPDPIVDLGVGLGIPDYSPHGVQAAMTAFWTCIQTLVDEGARHITLSGVPVSAALGRQRILALTHEVPARTGVPFDATLEAIVAGLAQLGTTHVVMGSRFPAETNDAIATYLREAEIEVLASTARDFSLSQARQLSTREGMQLALDVGRRWIRCRVCDLAGRERATVVQATKGTTAAALGPAGVLFHFSKSTSGVQSTKITAHRRKIPSYEMTVALTITMS